jgi:hypothetical protein
MTKLTTRQVDDDLTLDYYHYDYDVLELRHRSAAAGGPIFAHLAFRVATGQGGAISDPDGVRIELLDRPDLRDL